METGSTAHGFSPAGSIDTMLRTDAASKMAARMRKRRASSSAHCSRSPAGVRMSARSHHPRCWSSAEDQAGLNRLAEAHFVRNEQPRREAAHHRQRRLELKRQHIDRGGGGRAQLPECPAVRKVGPQGVHPAPRRNLPQPGLQFVPYRAIERVEKFAIDPLAVGPRRGEPQQRAVGKSHDFLDIPSVSADRDHVAGGELRECSHAEGSRNGCSVPGLRGARGARVERCRVQAHPRRALTHLRYAPRGLHRCAQVRVRRVEKFDHERMPRRALAARCRAGRRCRGRESAAPRAGPPRARRGRTRQPPIGYPRAGRRGDRGYFRSGFS